MITFTSSNQSSIHPSPPSRQDKTRGNVGPHFKGGAKKVIMCAPPKDDTPMFVIGVNEKEYKPSQHIPVFPMPHVPQIVLHQWQKLFMIDLVLKKV